MPSDREICEAATLGPWTKTVCRVLGPEQCSCGECTENETIARAREIGDAAFIAHFNPQHVMALLDVDAAARAMNESMDGGYRPTGDEAQALHEALARIDALNKKEPTSGQE